jgi:hypothetical protein
VNAHVFLLHRMLLLAALGLVVVGLALFTRPLLVAGASPGRAGLATPSPTPTLTPTSVPDTCERWAAYAGCDEGTSPCAEQALSLWSGTADIFGGGLHSNSGLAVIASSFSLSPTLAEWGTAGSCTGVLCPPGGPAVQVPSRPLPALYQWADFQPGGAWWNDMCQGLYAAQCHIVTGNITSAVTISSGLWVVDGDVLNPPLTAGSSVYTFVASGSVNFTSSSLLVFQPFVGSSTRNGSRAFVVALGADPGGVNLWAYDFLVWTGTIYAPNGLAHVEASRTQYMTGGVFARRAELRASDLHVTHPAGSCPPALGTPTATPAASATATASPTPAASATPTATSPAPAWRIVLPAVLFNAAEQ